MQTSERKLRNVLKINACFSTISGLLLIFYRSLIDKMGIGNYLTPIIIGVGLLLFAASIFYYATRSPLNSKQIKGIIIQDFIWVLGSVAVLIWRPWSLTGLGYLLICLVMITVAVFGMIQYNLLRKGNEF